MLVLASDRETDSPRSAVRWAIAQGLRVPCHVRSGSISRRSLRFSVNDRQNIHFVVKSGVKSRDIDRVTPVTRVQCPTDVILQYVSN